MDARIASRTAPRSLTWFEFGLGLFAAALPVGVILLLVAPVAFVQVLGAVIVGTGVVGLWVSALGLRLEHPERWNALKAGLRRLAAPVPATPVAER
jgi:hypothetical protein